MEQKTVEEALNVLANASAAYVGTRKDHEVILEALNVLRKAAASAVTTEPSPSQETAAEAS